MAKSPKYFTVKPKDDDRRHRVLGGANQAGTAAGATMKSASQSASKSTTSSKASGNTTGVGGGGGGGGGGTGSKGSSTGSVGPNSGANAPGNKGGGSQLGGGGKGSTTGSGGGKSTGPGGGSLSAPARTAPSSGNLGGGGGGGGKTTTGAGAGAGPKSPMSGQETSFKSPEAAKASNDRAIKAAASGARPLGATQFGPRAGLDQTAGTMSPSRIAADDTLNRIASGSSVISGYPSNKIQDRVPVSDMAGYRAPTTVTRLAQEPTVGPLRGLGPTPARPGSYSSDDLFAGANSPFADPTVSQYDRDTYNQMPASRALAQGYGQYRSPPSLGTTAYDTARAQISAGASPDGLPGLAGRSVMPAVASAPAPVKYQDRIYSEVPPSKVLSKQIYDRIEPEVAVGPVPTKQYYDRIAPEVPVSAAPPKQYYDRLSPQTPYGPMIANPDDPYGVKYAKTAEYLGQVPATRTAAKTRSISPVYGDVTPAIRTVAEAETPQPGPSNPVGQFVADKIADRFNTRVSPSQESGWMGRVDNILTDTFGAAGPNSAYARQMRNAADGSNGGGGGGGGGGNYGYQQPYVPPTTTTPTTTPTIQTPLPPYVNYQQLPPDYSTYAGVAPSQPVMDFVSGSYGGVAGYADGGSVASPEEEFGVMDRLKYAFENKPGLARSNIGPMRAMLWAFGLPDSGRPEKSLNSYFYNQAIGRGENPNETLPWLSKSSSSTAKPPEQKPTGTSELYPQVNQYTLPPPSAPISNFNNGADVLEQQQQLFRLPQKNGGGVGDRIDAAIRLAKSFS